MEAVERQTVGQLEREISQKIQALYKKNLGHQPGRVTCQLFDAKLAVILEDSITQPEQLLAEGGKVDLVAQIRSDLTQAIQPSIKALVEEILQVDVLDVLSDATLETGRTGMIIVMSATPEVRNPEAIPKLKKAQ
jgi:uncharacterized protein YbcI